MSAEAVPTAPPPEGWTVADVDALPDRDGVRYELVDGVPKALPPPRIRHQNAVRRLANALEATAPPGLMIVEGVGVVLAPDQRPIPDLVVVQGADPDSELYNVPAEQVVLAAEVVSPSTRSSDRFTKPALYSEAKIPCYLRVELDLLHVVGYHLGGDGLYREAARAKPGTVLRLDAPFPLTVDPAALVR